MIRYNQAFGDPARVRSEASIDMVTHAARRYLIGGRVQAVGFRVFTADAARREGLTGWVRNLPDGHVEAVVEGDERAVERFEFVVRRGPPGADVASFETEARAPSGEHAGFRVRL